MSKKEKTKRVGLIFGSFDPFHIGHFSMAIQALNIGDVDKVAFIPAKQNPWKKNSTPMEDRVRMILLGIDGTGKIVVNFAENLVESNHTYDVLLKLEDIHKSHNEELVIITTKETAAEIPNWYKGDEILKKYPIQLVEMPINIHSTDIRNMIKDGKNPLPYISNGVWDYIKEHKLYIEDGKEVCKETCCD